MASLHKCGKTWKRKDRANILRHLESCHVAGECLAHSRSPCSKNVIGVVQMDCIRLCSSKTAEENIENIIKLNVSPNRENIKKFASNLIIESHAGGARFEITITVLLFVVKNDIETRFLETGVKIRVHIIHRCALYTGKYCIRYIIYILRRLKAS